jgi:hypothetical protein
MATPMSVAGYDSDGGEESAGLVKLGQRVTYDIPQDSPNVAVKREYSASDQPLKYGRNWQNVR